MTELLRTDCFTPPKLCYNLPDFRDGLTPVQRKIIWNLKRMKLSNKGNYQRSSIVVHECGGEWDEMHDHWVDGKSEEIYDNITNMTQTQNVHALIDGHGNFGHCHLDGNAAAPRFTGVKLSRFCEEGMLKYCKSSKNMPESLFARVPGCLIMGTHTVSNGFVSRVPSHNLCEIINAMLAMLDNPDISLEEILRYIEGPDFINGGVIINENELAQIYKYGQGRLRIRGKTKIKTDKNGIKTIVITEIPETMRGKVKSFIDDVTYLSKYRIIEGIEDVKDLSLFQTKIEIILNETANPEEIMKLLFEKTNLEDEIDCQFILMEDGLPCRMSLLNILSKHLDYYRSILKNKYGNMYNDELLRCELLKIFYKYGTPRKTEIINV